MKYPAIFVIVALIGSFIAPPLEAKKARHKESIRDIIKEELAAIQQLSSETWEYMATRMRPPVNAKWKTRWDQIGSQKWELVARDENTYIFKRRLP